MASKKELTAGDVSGSDVSPPDRATLDQVVVKLLARLLNRSEDDIRADRSRYAAFHTDDSAYEYESGWIDWTTLALVEDSGDEDSDSDDDEDSGNDNLYGRLDFDLAKSLFDHDQFNHVTCTDKSLRRTLEKQGGSLYGAQVQALVAQERLDPETLTGLYVTGRIKAEGDSLVDAARALFKLDRFGQEPPLRPGPDSELSKKWAPVLAEIAPSKPLRDHLGIFFQTAEAARCSGAALDGDPRATLFTLDGASGYDVIAEWGVGEGQGSFYLVRIQDDAVPPVLAFEGRFLIRKKARAASAPTAPAEGSSLSLGERLAPHDALSLGFDDDAIETVADLRRRVEPKKLTAFMKPIGGSQGKLHKRCYTVAQGIHLLLEAGAVDAALALCEAAAPFVGDDLRALVFYNTGVALMKLERFGAAYIAFGQALAAAEKSARWAQVPSSHLQNNLAWTAFKSGQLDLAEAHIPLAIEADADNLLARGTAGSIAFARGRTDEAMQHFAAAMAGGTDPNPGPEVAARTDYRELAMRFGIPVELTDEEAASLGPDGYVDEVGDDDHDEVEGDDDDEDDVDDDDDEDDDEDE